MAVLLYHDWETVDGENDVVRVKLIYNTDFALKYAAGYLRLMEQAGIAGDFQLFMAYNISIDYATKWKRSGYSMAPGELRRIGIDVDVFTARVKHWNDAVRAIS